MALPLPAVSTPRQRVVIVGGGFAGITAAKSLARLPVEVTLVDRHNFHTFTPLLYQVATSGLAPDDIAPNLRGIVQRHPNVDAVMAEVRGVDFDRHAVLVENGPSIPYDTLVLAAGAVSSDFGVPGVHEHAIALKNLDDAIRVRSAVLRRFEEANTDPSLLDDGNAHLRRRRRRTDRRGAVRRALGAVQQGAGQGLQEPRRRAARESCSSR